MRYLFSLALLLGITASAFGQYTITAGDTNRSVFIHIMDSTDGTPETGVVAATTGLDLEYVREGADPVDLTESDLASASATHADGGMIHVGGGNYRVELPDAAFASGVESLKVQGTVTDMDVIGATVTLTVFDLQSDPDIIYRDLEALPVLLKSEDLGGAANSYDNARIRTVSLDGALTAPDSDPTVSLTAEDGTTDLTSWIQNADTDGGTGGLQIANNGNAGEYDLDIDVPAGSTALAATLDFSIAKSGWTIIPGGRHTFIVESEVASVDASDVWTYSAGSGRTLSVGAILEETFGAGAITSNVVDATATGEIADSVWDEDLSVGHGIANSGAVWLSDIIIDTANMQPKLGSIVDFGGGATIGDNLADMGLANRVWYVDANAAGEATGRNWTDAFTTLAAAQAAVKEGDRVNVDGDTHNTVLTLTVPGVHWVGNGATITQTTETPVSITATAVGAILEGFTVSGSTSAANGVSVSANNITLKNLTVTNTSGPGLSAGSAAKNLRVLGGTYTGRLIGATFTDAERLYTEGVRFVPTVSATGDNATAVKFTDSGASASQQTASWKSVSDWFIANRTDDATGFAHAVDASGTVDIYSPTVQARQAGAAATGNVRGITDETGGTGHARLTVFGGSIATHHAQDSGDRMKDIHSVDANSDMQWLATKLDTAKITASNVTNAAPTLAQMDGLLVNVDGYTVAGEGEWESFTLGGFSTAAKAEIEAEATDAANAYGALKPTTAGRTLDVTATGAAGIDWANVENPTTTIDFSGTTVNTIDVLTGHTAQTGDSFARLGAPTGASVSADIASLDSAVLKPTVAGRTLDVTVGGTAGIDWGNVESSATAVNLTNTTVDLVSTVTTLTGHTAQTGDSFARLGAPAGASVSADIAAINTLVDGVPTTAEFNARTLAAGSYFDHNSDTVSANWTQILGTALTETTGGNLAKNYSFVGDLDTTTTKTFNDMGVPGTALTSQDVENAVWDAAKADHAVADTFGDYLDTEVSGAGGGDPSAIADAVLDELLSEHTTSGTVGERLGRIPNAVAGTNGGLPTVDANNFLAGIQGTVNTFDGLNDPTAAAIGTQVRTELTNELGRIDVAISTRLSSAGYTTPPTVTEITADIDANSTQLSALITNLATVDTVADAIKVVTDDWLDAGRLDLILDEIKSDVDNIIAGTITETRDLEPVPNTWRLRRSGATNRLESTNAVYVKAGDQNVRAGFNCDIRAILPQGAVLASMTTPTSTNADLTLTKLGIDANVAKVEIDVSDPATAGTYWITCQVTNNLGGGGVTIYGQVIVEEDPDAN